MIIQYLNPNLRTNCVTGFILFIPMEEEGMVLSISKFKPSLLPRQENWLRCLSEKPSSVFLTLWLYTQFFYKAPL